jgi:hypothetical protein
MKTRTIVAVLVLLVIGITARAQNSKRSLMYSFKDRGVIISVGLIDSPRVPRGFVMCPMSPKRQKGFTVSRQQFDQTWQKLQSSGAEKFAVPESEKGLFDPAKNYLFTITDGPNGSQTDFVVPKTRASRALVALARQFEAYAR